MARRLWLLAMLASGCTAVDSVGSVGELGRLSFSVISDFYLEGDGFDQVDIVTRHPQHVAVSLTGRGGRYDKHADEIVYSVDLAGAEISQSEPDRDEGEEDTNADDPPGFLITADEPGTARITARLGADVVDYINFTFARPTELELVMFARGPWEEPFLPVVPRPDPIRVELGTQLAWLAIPRDGEDRLLGEMVPELGAEPSAAAVPGANVEHVNEDEAQSFFRSDTLYFVQTGEVAITLTDTANGVAGHQTFSVEDAADTSSSAPAP